MGAKKSLGQNFLKSKSIIDIILRAGEVSKNDFVLEIGPGKGILTEGLIKEGARVLAVEKDDELFRFLETKFVKEIMDKQLELVHGDILEVNLSKLGKYKLIANIPYNLTGKILKSFLMRKKQPSLVVFLLQKEVAERIIAKDGKEDFFSIIIKAYGKPQYIKKVPKEHFRPMPKVDSAILLIKDIDKSFFKGVREEEFFKLVKTGFAHKRKTISNNLREWFSENPSLSLEKIGVDSKRRAENLSLREWKSIFLSTMK